MPSGTDDGDVTQVTFGLGDSIWDKDVERPPKRQTVKDVPVQMAMAAIGVPGSPVTVFGADSKTPDVLEAYRDHGVERLALLLEPASDAETLRQLDAMAKLIEPLA